MFSLKTLYPAWFEPGSPVAEADMMSTTPSRQGRKMKSFQFFKKLN
jgi:hypothetical protein